MPKTPRDDALLPVVEDLVERQRQILGALVATTHPLKNDVQAVLLGLRGVETKLRNGAAAADATTPTNPADLRQQVARALSKAATSRGYRLRDERAPLTDAALSVVAPVLEGLCRTATEEQKRGDALYEERDKYIRLLMDEQEKVAALSSLLRGMARRVGEVRGEMRFATKHVDAWVQLADRLMSTRDRYRQAVSDQTPATPDGDTEFKGTAENLNPDAEIQGNEHVPGLDVDCTADEAACVHGQTADLTGLAARENGSDR